MQLLTKALLKKFAKVGRQEDKKDPLVIAKFFNPAGAGTWYATPAGFEPAISTLKGWRPRPLDDGANYFLKR
jgi:hypothetical protein